VRTRPGNWGDFRVLRRRTAYYLMFIHEHLPEPMRRELKQIG